MKVVLLSGGGGGARFARGLADVLEPGELTVVGNVGDDVEILGLHVSPDLDSLLYTLAGLIDAERGWGRADETWNALDSAADWGGENWFRLGDRDLGIHLVRTQLLRKRRSAVDDHRSRFADLCGIATTDRAGDGRPPAHARASRRRVASRSRSGSSAAATRTRSTRVEYEGAEEARAGAGRARRARAADAILLAPSNPYLSIGPDPRGRGRSRDAIAARRVRCVAVSPLVGGAAVTGPLARMLTRMAGGTTPAHVTESLQGPDRRARHRRVGRSCGRGRRARRRADAHARSRRRASGSRRSSWRRRARSDRRRDRPVRRWRSRRASSTRRTRSCSARVTLREPLRPHPSSACAGATNAEAVARRRSRRPRRRTPRPRSTPRGSFATAIGTTPAALASRPSFASRRPAFSRRPTPTSLAARIQAELDGPVVAGLHSLAASSLGAAEPPDEDAFVCGDDPTPRRSHSSSRSS